MVDFLTAGAFAIEAEMNRSTFSHQPRGRSEGGFDFAFSQNRRRFLGKHRRIPGETLRVCPLMYDGQQEKLFSFAKVLMRRIGFQCAGGIYKRIFETALRACDMWRVKCDD